MAIKNETEVQIGPFALPGILSIPEGGTREFVVFAHGAGSSRRSPRNRFIASELNRAGFGTLLMDLITHEEDRENPEGAQVRFNIDLLADRLTGATHWLEDYCGVSYPGELVMGYFGASTGAAAALVAASKLPDVVRAVVSRGGRPDLAGRGLSEVKAATLLIVGGEDMPLATLNEIAVEKIAAPVKDLIVIPNATHLFEEPGALEEVARLTTQWFEVYLRGKERFRIIAA
jgi:predicted alpha/beta-hydrolase family hydrolase